MGAPSLETCLDAALASATFVGLKLSRITCCLVLFCYGWNRALIA